MVKIKPEDLLRGPTTKTPAVLKKEIDAMTAQIDDMMGATDPDQYEDYEDYQKAKNAGLDKAAIKLIGDIFKNAEEKKGGTERTETIKKIAELLKEHKIEQIIIHSKENTEPGLEKGLSSQEDLDTRAALFLLNDFNKKSPEDAYSEDSVTSLIPKSGGDKNLTEKRTGLRIFLDVGGTHLKIEDKDGEAITVRIDHHGIGQTTPTSATKMVYEILQKANLLKEKPEWLEKFVDFVTEVDNLSYLEERDSKGIKIFNEDYFKNKWPNSLYAIVEKGIPFEQLVDLLKSGKIKDPSIPFTKKEIDGELGQTKIGNTTIALLCEEALKGKKNLEGVEKTIEGLKNAERYAKQENLDLENTKIGRIIYHNFGLIKPQKGKPFPVKILKSSIAFIGAAALGKSYVNWNQKEGTFHINSFDRRLSGLVEELNKKDPGCAIDVRGTMVFGKIKDLTEEEFLTILGVKNLKDFKKNKLPEEKTTPESSEIIENDTGVDFPEKESGLEQKEGNLTIEEGKTFKRLLGEINLLEGELGEIYAEIRKRDSEGDGGIQKVYVEEAGNTADGEPAEIEIKYDDDYEKPDWPKEVWHEGKLRMRRYKDGTDELYYKNGALKAREFPDGNIEHYDESGKMIYTTLKNGEKIFPEGGYSNGEKDYFKEKEGGLWDRFKGFLGKI